MPFQVYETSITDRDKPRTGPLKNYYEKLCLVGVSTKGMMFDKSHQRIACSHLNIMVTIKLWTAKIFGNVCIYKSFIHKSFTLVGEPYCGMDVPNLLKASLKMQTKIATCFDP